MVFLPKAGFFFWGIEATTVDVKSDVELVKKLAFKDKDITLYTKDSKRVSRPKKGFLRFLLKKKFRVFRDFRVF